MFSGFGYANYPKAWQVENREATTFEGAALFLFPRMIWWVQQNGEVTNTAYVTKLYERVFVALSDLPDCVKEEYI